MGRGNRMWRMSVENKKTMRLNSVNSNVHNGLGVKNISYLVLKEIYSICKTKNLTNKKKIEKY